MRTSSASRPTLPPYRPPADVPDEADPSALARSAADLRTRLARACAGLPPAEFDVLVERMARRALRWAARR
jgi:hypothetical protein